MVEEWSKLARACLKGTFLPIYVGLSIMKVYESHIIS